MKQLKLDITGEINMRIYDEIVKTIMHKNDFDEIVLIINSSGGSIGITMGIYDLLKSLNIKITTIAVGKCYSMATVLFALGEERYISKNTSYMLHQTRYTFNQDRTLTSGEAREMLKTSDLDEKRWKAIIKESCYKDISAFLDKVFSSQDDVFLTAEETVYMGIATAILKNLNDILSW